MILLRSLSLSLLVLTSFLRARATDPAETFSVESVQELSPLWQQRLSTVHPLWLRERCQEDFYADPVTLQPRFNLHEDVEDLRVTRVTPDTNKDEDGFVVLFSDDMSCFYPTRMLEAEFSHQQFFMQASEWVIPSMNLWNQSSLATLPLFHRDDVVDANNPVKRDFLATLLSTGVALVSDVPIQAGECIRFGTEFSTLRSTEWGDTFNVKSVPDTQNAGDIKQDLAYTPHAIGMHVDNPYRQDTPPAFQLLHALEHCEGASCRVHNQFVDGFAVAQALCQQNPDHFHVLAKTVLRWENNGGDGSSFLYRYAPMIEVAAHTAQDDCPPVEAINFSAKSGGYAPYMSDPNEQELFYKAKRAFSAMLHDPAYTLNAQLFPGALVIFDNRRVLHSRTAIAPTDGARWLQGCYIDRDGISFNYERLRRQWKHDDDQTSEGESVSKGCHKTEE